MKNAVRMQSVRPLVRYVDRDQAVIDTHVSMLPPLADEQHPDPATKRVVEIDLQIDGSDGFHDEGSARVTLTDNRGSVRFEVIEPQRWWSAGMGEQSLYNLSITLTDQEFGQDHRQITFGLTSVRRDRVLGEGFDPSLLVNGQICDIESIVVVDQIDENNLLPATGDSLLLVRDHFGPEVLYDAADRAGILLIQCVPIHPKGRAHAAIAEQVDRLAGHPSLAGYYVGHLGRQSDRVAEAIKQCDPTRTVFRDFPLHDAA